MTTASSTDPRANSSTKGANDSTAAQRDRMLERRRKRGVARAERLIRWFCGQPSWLHWIIGIVAFVIYGPAYVYHARSALRAITTQRLVMHDYDGLTLTWFGSVLGLSFVLLNYLGFPGEPLGWLWVWVVIYSIFTMGTDYNLEKWLLLGAAFLIGALILGWVGDRYNIPVLQFIYDNTRWVGMGFHRPIIGVLSCAFLTMNLVLFFKRSFGQTLRVEGNSVSIGSILKRDQTTNVGSYTFNVVQIDVNEAVLGGQASVTMRPKTQGVRLYEFRHVPAAFLLAAAWTMLMSALDVSPVSDGDGSSTGSTDGETSEH